MKTIGLLTINNALNYGAALQTYATIKIFNELGFKTITIDYSTTQDLEYSKLFSLTFSKESIKYNIRNLLYFQSFNRRKSNFKKFAKSYFNLSKLQYSVENITTIDESRFDFFVTGSDQTFNLNLGGKQLDREQYYLPFIRNNYKKISFSSSMGEHISSISPTQKEWISKQLKSFKAVSVREPQSASLIFSMTGVHATVLPDPTFLISSSEWDIIANPSPYIQKKYILFYTVLSAPWVIEYVQLLSKSTGMTVICAHPKNLYEVKTTFVRADSSGPAEFLSLVKNATMVVTTSYHGTIFSIKYKKPFVSLILGEGNRITSLLRVAGLESCGYSQDNVSHRHDFVDIDYSQSDSYFKEAKINCQNYLQAAFDI